MLTREASVASSPVILGSGEHHVLAVHGWFGSASGWGSPPEYLDGSAYMVIFAIIAFSRPTAKAAGTARALAVRPSGGSLRSRPAVPATRT